MTLIIDNYDSFTYNLSQAIESLGVETRVVRNDKIDVSGIEALGPDRLVISPGPGDPDSAGVSLAAVALFSVKPSELKTRGAELGMLPLNIMSALGDIISYVRLFAVGLASVKVAENFNGMATGLVSGDGALWAKALLSVAMVAILLIGHALNIAMAGLSVLVHAVRLNTLEFSNHKGVSWSGYAFSPFRKGK